MSHSVEENLLGASGIDRAQLTGLLDGILSHQTNFADLYFQSSQHESWVLEDGIIKDGSYNIERGVGVRAISGEKTGFAYSDEISFVPLSFPPFHFLLPTSYSSSSSSFFLFFNLSTYYHCKLWNSPAELCFSPVQGKKMVGNWKPLNQNKTTTKN